MLHSAMHRVPDCIPVILPQRQPRNYAPPAPITSRARPQTSIRPALLRRRTDSDARRAPIAMQPRQQHAHSADTPRSQAYPPPRGSMSPHSVMAAPASSGFHPIIDTGESVSPNARSAPASTAFFSCANTAAVSSLNRNGYTIPPRATELHRGAERQHIHDDYHIADRASFTTPCSPHSHRISYSP